MALSSKTLFPGQLEEEKIILLLRKHWFNYIIFVFLTILALVPIIIGVAYWSLNSDTISNVAKMAILIFDSSFLLSILALQLYGFVDYYLDVYIVTDRRIVDISQNGFFKRDISELHLHQVQDVNAKVDGIFQTVLHFGDVQIQTAGEQKNFEFKSIPHPYRVAKQIIDLHQSHIETLKRNGSPFPGPTSGTPTTPPDARVVSQPETSDPLREDYLNYNEVSDDRKKPIEKDYPLPENREMPHHFKNEGSTTESQIKMGTDEGQLKEGREVDLE